MLKHISLLILTMIILMSLVTACGGKTATTTGATTPATTTQPAATTTTAATTSPPATETPTATTPANSVDNDYRVAIKMSDLLDDIEAIQTYYDDGLTAVATFQVSETESLASGVNNKTVVFLSYITVRKTAYGSGFTTKYFLPYAPATAGKKKVPTEFLNKLPGSGAMPAPPGACPAAAEPQVTFITVGGDAVTPDLIAEKDIETISSELVTMAQNDPDSLVSLIENMVPMNDQRLATVQGWDDLLWSKLEDMQEPAASLMDYQLWNASSEIMRQIASQYRERLAASGVPQNVLDAYDASASGDWYANSEPTPGDALTRMEIDARMTGSINGDVHEQRDFTIQGASQTPIYGTQTGTGQVTWDHPTLGTMNFDVNINLDQFDAEGRAIGGTTVGVDAERGYEIRFTYLPDGTKAGELLKDGEPVGQLTMTTNAEKFKNYIDVKTNETIEIPE